MADVNIGILKGSVELDTEAYTSALDKLIVETGAASKQIEDAFKNAGSAVSAGAEAVGSGVTTAFTSMGGFLSGIFNQIGGMALKAFEGLGGSVESVFKTVRGAIEDPLDAAKKLALGIIDSMGPVGLAIAGVVAAFAAVGAAMYEFASKAAAVGGKLNDMSETTGETVENLSKLRFAMDVSGGSIDQASNAIFQMSRRMVDGTPAATKLVSALGQLNVNAEAFKAASPNEQILMLSEGFRNLPEGVNRSAVSMELFGRQGRTMLPLLMKDLQGLEDESEKLGLVWTGSDAKAAEEFEMNGRRLGEMVEGVGVSIGKMLIPSFNELYKSLFDIVDALSSNTGAWGDFKSIIGSTITILGEIGSKVETVIGVMYEWSGVKLLWQTTKEVFSDVGSAISTTMRDIKNATADAAIVMSGSPESLDYNIKLVGEAAKLVPYQIDSFGEAINLLKMRSDAAAEAQARLAKQFDITGRSADANLAKINKAAKAVFEGKSIGDQIAANERAVDEMFSRVGGDLAKVEAGLKAGTISAKELGATYGATSDIVGMFVKRVGEQEEAQKKAEAATKKSEDAVKKHNETIKTNIEGLEGDTKGLKDVWDMYNNLTPAQWANDSVVKNLVEKYEDVRKKLQPDQLPAELEALRQSYGKGIEKTKDLSSANMQLGYSYPILSSQVGVFGDRLYDLSKPFEDQAVVLGTLGQGVNKLASEMRVLGTRSVVDMEAFRKSMSFDWGGTLNDLSTAFSQLSQISGGAFDGIAKSVGTVIGQMNTLMELTKSFTGIIGSLAGVGGGTQAPGIIGSAANWLAGKIGAKPSLAQIEGTASAPGFFQTKGGQTASAAMSVGFGMLGSALDQSNAPASQWSRGKQVGSMAAQGASIGANPLLAGATGGLSIAIGAGVGALIGAFKATPKDVQALNQIGKNYGVAISDGLAKQIADDAEKIGDLQAAEIMNVSKVFETVTSKNFTQATKMTKDLFVEVQRGKLTTQQAGQSLDEMWPKLVSAGSNAYGVISDSLKNLIDLNKEWGTDSKEIAAFLGQQSANAIAAAGNITAAIELPLAQFAETRKQATDVVTKQNQADLDTAIANLKSLGDVSQEQIDALTLASKTRTDAYVSDTGKMVAASVPLQEQQQAIKGELEDMTVAAMASYNAAIKNGMSQTEAAKQLSPALQNIEKGYEAIGLKSEDAALNALMFNDTIVRNNPTLMTALDGLSQEMTALDNLGSLNTDTLESMERQGERTFVRMQDAASKAGGGQKEALQPMLPFLQQMQDEAQKYNLKLDDGTQQMIDQAKELGIWKDKGKDATSILTGSIDTLNTSIQSMVKLFQEKIPAAIDAIPKKVTVDVTADYSGWQGPPQQPQGEGSGFATGGVAYNPQTAAIAEHGPEIIGSIDFMTQALVGAMAQTGGSRGGDVYIGVYADGRTVKMSPSQFRREFQQDLDTGVYRVPSRFITGRT